MQWSDIIMQVIEYIENHLTGQIDKYHIEKISCSSYYNFGRVFMFVFNMSLAEYIRYRRLSLAAEDLMNDEKIIDIALKYGYETHESFSRAFLQFHGVLPSEAKQRSDILKYCSKAEIETDIKARIKIGKLQDKSGLHILKCLKVMNVHHINLSELVSENNHGTIFQKAGEISVSAPDDTFTLMTSAQYQLPIRIDLTAKTNSTNLKLIYGKGDITFNWKYDNWVYKMNDLMIHDILTGESFDYPNKGKIDCDTYLNLSWILTRKYMALCVNDELRYYNEFLPYIQQLENNNISKYTAKVGVAPAWGSIITLKKLTISELAE